MIKFKLKVLLAENEMTAAELSEKIGVRQATLSAMNKGTIKQVPLHVIDGICSELNCEVGDLIKYVPTEKEQFIDKEKEFWEIWRNGNTWELRSGFS